MLKDKWQCRAYRKSMRESIEPSVMVGTCAVCVSKVELGGLISFSSFITATRTHQAKKSTPLVLKSVI